MPIKIALAPHAKTIKPMPKEYAHDQLALAARPPTPIRHIADVVARKTPSSITLPLRESANIM
jgi:hypothetical protein